MEIKFHAFRSDNMYYMLTVSFTEHLLSFQDKGPSSIWQDAKSAPDYNLLGHIKKSHSSTRTEHETKFTPPWRCKRWHFTTKIHGVNLLAGKMAESSSETSATILIHAAPCPGMLQSSTCCGNVESLMQVCQEMLKYHDNTMQESRQPKLACWSQSVRRCKQTQK
jgi:hypothetical protein